MGQRNRTSPVRLRAAFPEMVSAAMATAYRSQSHHNHYRCVLVEVLSVLIVDDSLVRFSSETNWRFSRGLCLRTEVARCVRIDVADCSGQVLHRDNGSQSDQNH